MEHSGSPNLEISLPDGPALAVEESTHQWLPNAHDADERKEMNLRFTNGRIPVHLGDRIVFMALPEREMFNSIFRTGVKPTNKDFYWAVINGRLSGKTLLELAGEHGVSKERIRAVEAKTIRLLSDRFRLELSSKTDLPDTIRP